MIKSITTTFDFGKLLKALPEIESKHTSKIKKFVVDDAREMIRDGKLRNLKKSTLDISKKYLSNKRKNIARTSNNALFHSGSLLRSIKEVDKGIEVNKYAKYHMDGFNIVSNKWTRKFIPNAIGTHVAPRNPFFTNKGNFRNKTREQIAKSLIEFHKKIAKALRHKRTIRF
tara:strand:+ start:274 stop:786 length:513 start_codon:yes stop_codon:yes gene_type:complete